MKIVIIGAQGTGKSILSKVLSEELNIPLITEIARNFKKEQLKCTNPEYPQIQKEILRLQIQEEKMHDNFISDRSSIDNLAYFIYGCSDSVTVSENMSYTYDAIFNARLYTHIFFLRPEFDIVNDNFRDCDPVYQKDIDTTIYTILKIFNIKHYILTGTIENRIQKTMEILEQ